MSILHLMGPVFLHINLKTAAAPAEEFWEKMGSKSPRSKPTVAPVAVEEAAFAISAELKQ
jgi:hypothetical protein